MARKIVDKLVLEAAIEFIRDPELTRTGLMRLSRQEVIDQLNMAKEVD